MKGKMINQVVYTNPAKCRDCYRCVRVCPVNAIKIEDHQAEVISEKCIACGTCVNECPQHAKQYHREVEKVINLLNSGKKIAISVAPSFAGIFSLWEQKRLASALRDIGFTIIEETAVGAYPSARDSLKHIESEPSRSHIASACPAVIDYIEKYRSQNVQQIIPVNSPMLAHAKMIKSAYGPDVKVVFVGPCIAKKQEALRNENIAFIDGVLTFTELKEIFEMKKIYLKSCEESSFDRTPYGYARLFPLEGGMLKTASLGTDLLSENISAVSGFDGICESLESIDSNHPQIIEPLFCRSGCINGPCSGTDSTISEMRKQVLLQEPSKDEQNPKTPSLRAKFRKQSIEKTNTPDEQTIQSIYAKTGKASLENQLNCGACGYDNCRDNAIAVHNGMAEVEMCIPYMRRLAELKNDTIVNAAPNGIVIIDKKLNIININPSFKRMFSCTDSIIGKPISYLIDQDPFEKLIVHPEEVVKKVVKYSAYNLICHQIHYALPDEGNYIGVFVDITDVQKNELRLKEIKRETVMQAQELIEHQILMSQNIAKFLGENTAKGEILMQRLLDVIDEND